MAENDGFTPPGQRSYAEQEAQDIEKIRDEENRKEEAEESDVVEVDEEGNVEAKEEESSSNGSTDTEEGENVNAESRLQALKSKAEDLRENARGNARLERTKQAIQELREEVNTESRSRDQGDVSKREAQEQVFGSVAPDQSGGETLQDRLTLIEAQNPDEGLPDDKEKLEDLEEFVEDNPSAQNDFNNIEEAVETKRKAVEREQQVDDAIDDLQDAPTREERLENINERLQEAEKREETENIELDISELEDQKERLQSSEGLYVIQEDGEEEVVSKDELESELQEQKEDLQQDQRRTDIAFQKSNTTVSRETRIEEKAEEVDLQEDFVETDSAYTEAGNTILEAGKTATAYGETLLSSRGTDLVTSVVPGGESPSSVVEENIAEDLIQEDQSVTDRAVDRFSSPPGMLVGFFGVGAGASKGIQLVSRASGTAGKTLQGAVAGAEAVEITRRGFQAGREFGQGDVEEGFEPLVKLGVEEAGARAGARAVADSGTTSTTRVSRRTDPSGNQVAEDDFPTSDQLPRTGQRMDFEVRNTEDVIPTEEDVAGTRDLEVLQAGNRREVPQEATQVQGEQGKPSDGLDDQAEPLQRGGEEDVFGTREDRVGLRNQGQEDELLSLNEEARSQTNLETRETASSSNNQGRTDSEDPQIGNSDVVNEEGFTPEEAEVLAEQEQAVGVSGVSETGGLEIQVQAVDDLGTLQRVDFGEVASDIAPGQSRKGQLQLTQQQETPAERFDITDDIELVGGAEEPDFEISASGEDFQVTRLDQASSKEVEALGVAPLEQETGTEEVVRPETDADIEIESEIVQSEFNEVEEAEVSVVESFSEEENINEERPVVSGVSEDVSSSVGQGNQVGFQEETGEIQDIQEEIVPQEEVREEEIPGRAVGRTRAFEVREARASREGFGRFDQGRGREGREGRADFDLGNDFEDEEFTLDQGENLPGERQEEEEFLPDLLSANTSELLFGSATFDVSADETATGRQFTVEQEENLEETEDNFEVRF